MNDRRTNNEVVELLSMSEEVTSISYKVKQLIEDLHSSSDVLATLKEMTTALNGKMAALSSGVDSYVPISTLEEGVVGTPSYQDGINERVRVVPTPQNQAEFKVDEPLSQPIASSIAPEMTPAVVDIKPETIDAVQNVGLSATVEKNEPVTEEKETPKKISRVF